MSLLRRVTFRQLQIFAAAAHHQSLARAAEELHLSQPAVSMQIKQLEDTVSLALFERVGRNSTLTSAGKELLQHAESVLSSLKDAEDSLAAIRAVRKGEITIATVSTAKYYVPQLIARFRDSHPWVGIDIEVGNRDSLIQLLRRNQVDVAIMGQPPVELDAVSEPFASHPHGIIAAPGHPLARLKTVAPQRLSGATFLAREPGSGTRSVMEKFIARHHLQIHLGTMFTSNESIKQAVMAGMGLGFVSLHTLPLELQARQLTVLNVRGTPVVRTWHIVYRRSKKLSPATQAFKEFVLAYGAKFLEEKFKMLPLPATRPKRS
jgi:DNA-binding transcriptional LysR family regulator